MAGTLGKDSVVTMVEGLAVTFDEKKGRGVGVSRPVALETELNSVGAGVLAAAIGNIDVIAPNFVDCEEHLPASPFAVLQVSDFEVCDGALSLSKRLLRAIVAGTAAEVVPDLHGKREFAPAARVFGVRVGDPDVRDGTPRLEVKIAMG